MFFAVFPPPGRGCPAASGAIVRRKEASQAVQRAILQTAGNERFINQVFFPLSGSWTERSPLPATLYSVLARLPFRAWAG